MCFEVSAGSSRRNSAAFAGLRALELAEPELHRLDRRAGVAGDVDLGDDVDVALGGVGEDVLEVGGGVEPAALADEVERRGLEALERGRDAAVGLGPGRGLVGDVIAGGEVVAVAEPDVEHAGLVEVVAAARAERGQLGDAGDLEPPALVVGEVEVELVELVVRHHVEQLLDGLPGLEVPGDVEVHAAEREAGRVGDVDLGQRDLARPAARARRGLHGVGRDQLAQGLDAVKHAGGVAAVDRDPAVRHVEHVGLGVAPAVAVDVERGVEGELDDRRRVAAGVGRVRGVRERGGAAGGDLAPPRAAAEHVVDRRGQVGGLAGERVGVFDDGAAHDQPAAARHDLAGHRQQLVGQVQRLARRVLGLAHRRGLDRHHVAGEPRGLRRIRRIDRDARRHGARGAVRGDPVERDVEAGRRVGLHDRPVLGEEADRAVLSGRERDEVRPWLEHEVVAARGGVGVADLQTLAREVLDHVAVGRAVGRDDAHEAEVEVPAGVEHTGPVVLQRQHGAEPVGVGGVLDRLPRDRDARRPGVAPVGAGPGVGEAPRGAAGREAARERGGQGARDRGHRHPRRGRSSDRQWGRAQPGRSGRHGHGRRWRGGVGPGRHGVRRRRARVGVVRWLVRSLHRSLHRSLLVFGRIPGVAGRCRSVRARTTAVRVARRRRGGSGQITRSRASVDWSGDGQAMVAVRRRAIAMIPACASRRGSRRPPGRRAAR